MKGIWSDRMGDIWGGQEHNEQPPEHNAVMRARRDVRHLLEVVQGEFEELEKWAQKINLRNTELVAENRRLKTEIAGASSCMHYPDAS